MEGFAFLGMLLFMLEPTFGPAFASGGLAEQVNAPTSILWGLRAQVPIMGTNAVRLRLDRFNTKLRPDTMPVQNQDDPHLDYRSIALDHLWGAGKRGWYSGVGIDRTRWIRDSVVGRGVNTYNGQTYTTEFRNEFSKDWGWGGSVILGRSGRASFAPVGSVWTLVSRLTVSKGVDGRTETFGGITIGFAFRPWDSAK